MLLAFYHKEIKRGQVGMLSNSTFHRDVFEDFGLFFIG